MENGRKYINFPLPLVRRVLTDGQRGIDLAINFAVFRASLTVKAERRAAYSQLIYMAARHAEQVPDDLQEEVDDYFDGDFSEIINEKGVDEDITADFMANSGKDNEAAILEWYRVYLAQEICGVKLGSLPQTIEVGHEYAAFASGNVPVSVSTDMIFRLRDGLRTEYDRMKCAMYLAIRSLAGNDVALTTATAIKWRAFGCRNGEELNAALKDKRLKSIWEKWTSRYYYRTILDELIDANLIRQIAYGRHTAVTASLIDDELFAEAVATKLRRKAMAAKRQQVKTQQQQLAAMIKNKIDTS